jgi:hypothetical protein
MIALLVILIIGAWLVYEHVLQTQLDKYNLVLSQAQALDRGNHHQEEKSVLLAYLKTGPPKQYRSEPLMILGDLAFDNRDDSGAISYYQQAVASSDGKLTELQAESIGEAAAAAGNKTVALEYFKKAIQLTVVSPGVSSDIDDLKATVSQLESGK